MAMALVTTTSGNGRHGTTDKSPCTIGNVTVELNPEATFDVPRLSPVSDRCPKINAYKHRLHTGPCTIVLKSGVQLAKTHQVDNSIKSCSIRPVWNSAYLQMISGVFPFGPLGLTGRFFSVFQLRGKLTTHANNWIENSQPTALVYVPG